MVALKDRARDKQSGGQNVGIGAPGRCRSWENRASLQFDRQRTRPRNPLGEGHQLGRGGGQTAQARRQPASATL